MKYIFLVLISIFFLQSCVPAAVIGAAVGTKIAIDPRTIGTQIDDNTLELRVNNALSKDVKLKRVSRINAIAYQSKILLVGQAPSLLLAYHAEKIAMNIKGTSKVFNEIRQGTPVNLDVISSDIWITAKIRSRFMTSNQVKSANIKITTENGEVFLLGVITCPNEEKIAMDIASHVNGVKHITAMFTYKK